jgi:hypothetical protein
LKTGHFYFAENRTFLFCLDSTICFAVKVCFSVRVVNERDKGLRAPADEDARNSLLYHFLFLTDRINKKEPKTA